MEGIKTVRASSIDWNRPSGSGRRTGKWQSFIRSIEPGDAKVIPVRGQRAYQTRATVRRAARSMKINVVTAYVAGGLAVKLK